MKSTFPAIVERGRIAEGKWATRHSETFGMFFVKHPRTGRRFKVMVGDGSGWDHVSVSLERRCPTWDEMCWIKNLFFEAEERVVQFHPPVAEYVTNCKNCLHLWKLQHEEFPSPPEWMVGVKSLGEIA